MICFLNQEVIIRNIIKEITNMNNIQKLLDMMEGRRKNHENSAKSYALASLTGPAKNKSLNSRWARTEATKSDV
jgi:hypothetical protein